MKVGDYVAWAEHEDEDAIPAGAGIILEVKPHENLPMWQSHARYLILLEHNGELSWEHGSDLTVMYESR